MWLIQLIYVVTTKLKLKLIEDSFYLQPLNLQSQSEYTISFGEAGGS